MVYVMSNVNFYNGDRALIMSFSEFSIERYISNFISFHVYVKNDIIQASVNTECTEEDFTNFLAKLHDLYEMREKKSHFFNLLKIIFKLILIEMRWEAF